MQNANNFFNDLIKGASNDLMVAKMGKIVKFYPETQSADVIPMPTKDNAVILNVPIATIKCSDFFIYYPLKAGDTVLMVFCDNDTENIKLGTDSVQTERNHDITDAVIVGGFSVLTKNLSIADADALCLQNTENSASIVLTKDGNININAKKFKVNAERIDLN